VADVTPQAQLPRFFSPPGDTIVDCLDTAGWTQADLAERMGRTKKHVQDLVKNKTRITSDTAVELSRTLGGSVQFWLNLEANYQAAIAERESLKRHDGDRPWLKELPIADMRKLGWIEPANQATANVDACLRFFGVASVKGWRDRYASQLVKFRTGKNGPGRKVGAIAAWIRRAETVAGRIDTAPWSRSRFLEMVNAARSRTRVPDQTAALKDAQTEWAAAGVAVVFVRRPKACSVFGAAQWLAPDRALIAVSDRYATADQLWFTLLHEAAHLLLHGKKKPHVDDAETGSDDMEEREANTFATERLIPRAAWEAFLGGLHGRRPSFPDVNRLADAQHVAPGVVVGRLQHERRIPYASPLRSFKVSFDAAMFATLEGQP
jgi:HTH-type transcriptional regulator / antitoxin HigA